MPITITSNKLKNLIKESLKEVLEVEFMKLRADLMPYVSEREQREIEKLYRKPTRKVAKSIKIKI
jgi:hypothetical protein